MRNCAPGPQLEVDDISATSPELLRFMTNSGDSSGLVCVVARVNGRTAGVASMRERSAGLAAIIELTVAGPWRGTGIERHLAEALQQRAHDRGWTLTPTAP
ncbi:MAG TPA: GNAT family N-acetyltransferase [Vicinamibacterales bacterium]|nr:GNAT family N-acetyltransferase [Vicinamibacterales bacterium]